MPSVSIGDFHAYFEQISTNEEREEGLNKLNKALTLDCRESALIIKELGLKKIFRCLSSKNESLVKMTCNILKFCFNNYSPVEIINNYMPFLMYLLRHPHHSARQLALKEIYRALPDMKSPADKYRDVFVAVAHLIADKEAALDCKAIRIVSNAPTELCPQILEEIKIFLELDDTSVKCNTFEVALNISVKSAELLQLCGSHGFIKFMMDELVESSDVLYQTNILQLLCQLAAPLHGIMYLVECGTLAQISDFTMKVASDELLLEGILKFFGSIAHVYPEVFKKYPNFLNVLFEFLYSPNDGLVELALDILGFIGSRVEGKLSLAALGSVYTTAVTHVGELIRNSRTEVKIGALQCLAGLIGYDKDPTVPPNGPVDHRVTLMTREWFRSMSTNPPSMDVLHNICKNPFPDIKLAAFGLLDATCQHRWAEELVAQTPGFIEYLLDRSLDYTKESKEAKYEVIKKLAQSTAFDANIIIRLKKYVDDGPFHIETTLEVAMEEE